MLRLAVLDANEKAGAEWAGIVDSVVGQWLRWEMEQAGYPLTPVADADVVLLAYTGSIDYRKACTRELRRAGIEPRAGARGARPYVITGGSVDGTPQQALDIADALVVGEGYGTVRALLAWLREGATVEDLERQLQAWPHSLTATQLRALPRDRERPWLYAERPPILATPDPWVDWAVPPVKSDDGVVRVIGSKGCHFKCAYCATTYRQTYRSHDDPSTALRQMHHARKAGERVSVISNDPLNLAWYKHAPANDSGSYTIEEMLAPGALDAIIRQRPKMMRFGVEGLSERIRFAWGKPIPDATLLEVSDRLQAAKINCHWFMIVGAPYEGDEDWAAWRGLWGRLVQHHQWGLMRVKLTTYSPTPPAPLMRFVRGAWWAQWEAWNRWKLRNRNSRHITMVWPRQEAQNVVDVADQLGVPQALAREWMIEPVTHDLAPTPEDFARMMSEVIAWPIPAATRWRVAETYRERMQPGARLPRIATERRETRARVAPAAAAPEVAK